jgi:hypothetical protein
MQCNEWLEIKDQILLILASHLHPHHFFSSTPSLASNIQKVMYHLPEEVEEALDDTTDMTYNPEEEDYEERHYRNGRWTLWTATEYVAH